MSVSKSSRQAARSEGTRRVVVTGIGMVHPHGIGHEQVWSSVRAGRSAIRDLDRFDPAHAEVNVAGQLPPEFNVRDFLPARYAKRTDPFTQYGMIATDLAMQDAKLDLATEDPFRIGTSFGNSGGGWGLYERGLNEYFHDGPTMVNPYLATSWFNYAAQGYASIRQGLRGDSATYVAGRASGALATYFGVRSVQWGINDVVLAGGCEAPLTPLGLACHASSGELSLTGDYRPFTQARNGMVLSEGSTILVLEEESRARQRGAHIYGKVLAIRHSRADPGASRGPRRAMTTALQDAGIVSADVGAIFAEGTATPSGDRIEAAAIREVFGESTVPPVTVPRAGYGHQHGASFATELGLGLLAAGEQVLPPTPGYSASVSDLGLRLDDAVRYAELENVLVNSFSKDGMCTSTVISTELH